MTSDRTAPLPTTADIRRRNRDAVAVIINGELDGQRSCPLRDLPPSPTSVDGESRPSNEPSPDPDQSPRVIKIGHRRRVFKPRRALGRSALLPLLRDSAINDCELHHLHRATGHRATVTPSSLHRRLHRPDHHHHRRTGLHHVPTKSKLPLPESHQDPVFLSTSPRRAPRCKGELG